MKYLSMRVIDQIAEIAQRVWIEEAGMEGTLLTMAGLVPFSLRYTVLRFRCRSNCRDLRCGDEEVDVPLQVDFFAGIPEVALQHNQTDTVHVVPPPQYFHILT